MIRTLSIKNYKNIQDLDIKGIGKVNLFTGKNNTGKSTLLEAISIYASDGEFSVLSDILKDRGEILTRRGPRQQPPDVNQAISAVSSLFTNRKGTNGEYKTIFIGESSIDLFGEDVDYSNGVMLDLVQYYEDSDEAEGGDYVRRKTIVVENDAAELLKIDTEIGLRIRKGESQRLVPISTGRFDYLVRRSSATNLTTNFQLIKSTNLSNDENGTLWDRIALTDKEEFVIRGLKIIEPDIQRLAFIGEGNNERTTVVRLNQSKNVIPLQSMGDGINRILSIVLAAVNSDNGILLIDEFENGLHHTVQKDLWEIIFKLSETLNIQVFATTHSNDCIRGFEDILNSYDNVSGKLIRLERKTTGIRVVEFDKKELQVATDNDIETR